ncbi:MAG: hypothetical protein U9Q06_03130 [Nanoarchaeota archaeon]|nr:hypothetical protein [Nanoarchaeota archaeon]
MTDRTLYDHKGIKIEHRENYEGHNLKIAGLSYTLMHDVLTDLARARTPDKLIEKLETSQPGIRLTLSPEPLTRLPLAITQARIAELEEERNYFIGKIREAKESCQ